MKLANYEIRPFVVCVPEMPARTQFIIDHFRERGVLPVEVFNGISGRDSGLVTEHTYDFDNPGTNYKIGKNPVACWVSFYMLWSALNILPDAHFMTMEYDAKFDADWRPRAEQAMKDVPPDFDLLYLGSCCCKGKPMKRIKGDVYEMNQMQCGHCTIVAKKALPIMLATQRKVYAPLDVSLAFHTLPHLKCYVVLPRPVSQFDTFLPP